MEDKGEGGGNKGKEAGHLAWRDKGLALDGQETDMAHKRMVVYKGKKWETSLGWGA